MNVLLKDKETILVTEDDRKLIKALSNGSTRSETAQILKVKENTMDMRLRRLRLKIGLKTNYQLIAHFLRSDWIK